MINKSKNKTWIVLDNEKDEKKIKKIGKEA